MTTNAEQTRRDRLLDLTKVLLDKGIELVAEKDDGNFTVQEIASHAGVTLHTFYRIFPTKDYLALAIFEEVNRTGTLAIAEMAGKAATPLERLRLTIVAPILPGFINPQVRASYIVSEEHRLSRMFPAEVNSAFRYYRELLASAIVAAEDEGGYSSADPDADAELIQLLQMPIYHLVAQNLEMSQKTPPHVALWEFCLGALRRDSYPPASRKKKSTGDTP